MFKDKKFDDALSTYETALDYVQDLKEEAAKALVLSLRLNIAICGTKTKSYKKSITQATKVLENEGPSNPKALYWRAVAKKKSLRCPIKRRTMPPLSSEVEKKNIELVRVTVSK